MMTIKVRAYHKELKRMISTNELVKDQMTLLADGRFINVSGVDSRLSQIVPRDRMIPLLFTGLFDKNKKEIYEGDILKTNNHLDYIEWKDEFSGFKYHSDKSRMTMVDWFENGQYAGVEVIGNIYENPELLKGGKWKSI